MTNEKTNKTRMGGGKMPRLNLQLFATLNTKQSVVDYLKSQGKDSSMSARKEIAKELGIKNYSGTYEQNVQMLKTLQSQDAKKTETPKTTTTATKTETPKATTATTPATTTVSAVSGVDQSLVDTINSSFTQSDKVTNAQNEANESKDKLKEISDVKDIVSQETWDALNSQWNGGSSAYQEAMNKTNQLLEQLSSGRTSYTDQIKDMMAQIQNREKFQYDISTDTMFQQSLANAMVSGQSAMADTIGQASALTGGYASTYATSAGNQSYNAYIQDAYNNLPEYYNMALEAYQMEGQEMYNQLAMLNDADATEYGRMYDAWQANFTNAQNMYNQEYGAWKDSVNNAYNSANVQISEYSQLYNSAYNTYNALQDNANTLYEHEYQQWQDKVNTALGYANLQNADYWSNQNFLEDQRQFDEGLAWDKESFAQQMAEEQRQYNMTYAQNQSQFEASQKQNNDHFMLSNYDYNGDGKIDAKDTEYKAQMDAKTNESTYKSPTQTQKQKALEAYNTGGESAYYQYLDSLPSDVDVEEIDAYVNGDGKDNKGYGQLPLAQRTFTVVDDGGINWFGGVNGNAKVRDQYGNEYTLDQIKKDNKALAEELSGLKKGDTYKAK